MRVDRSYHEERTLADGTHLTLRLLCPGDGEELRRQFRRLSPSSRYRRFLTDAPDLTDEQLRYLTDVDDDARLAVVAMVSSHDLKSESGAGIARYVRLADEPAVAEAAVTVTDDVQRRGVGRALLEVLSVAARERGIERFRAEVLASNEPVRGLLDTIGAEVREDNGETLVFDITLDAPDGTATSSSAVLRLLRAAAASLTWLFRSAGLRPRGAAPPGQGSA